MLKIQNFDEEKNEEELKRQIDPTKRLDFVEFVRHEITSPDRNRLVFAAALRSFPIEKKQIDVTLPHEQMKNVQRFEDKCDDEQNFQNVRKILRRVERFVVVGFL